MIHKTFYNLENSKKEKIIKAIEKEVIKKGVEKSKVVSICENAEIPRSAFYRYFDSIDDSFIAMVEYLQKSKQEKIIKLFQDKDIYEVSINLLEEVLSDEEQFIIFRNSDNRKFKLHKKRINNFVLSMSEEERLILKMLVNTIKGLTLEYYEEGVDKDQVINEFKQFISILKKSVN